MFLLVPILTALAALPLTADARAVDVHRSSPVAPVVAPFHPAFQKPNFHAQPTHKPTSVHQYLKRSAIPNPTKYDTPYTPTYIGTLGRTSTKNVFLSWNSAGDFSTSMTYPRLVFSVAKSDGTSCSTCAAPVPTASVYSAWVDTGSAPIIVWPAVVGGKGNLDTLDPNNYNGYQYFPLEGALYLGRWTKLQITLKSSSGASAKVVATPTVLVATYVVTGCSGFNGEAQTWPDPTVSGFDRNAGPTRCPQSGFVDPSNAFVGDTGIWGGPWAAPYFGIGWGNFNSQIPVKSQFVRGINSITDNSGNTYTSTSGALSSPSWIQGYTIGRKGIQFGLVANDQCIYYPLKHSVFNAADWTRPEGCIQFYNLAGTLLSGGCQQGQILPDTGASIFNIQYGTPYPVNFPISTSSGDLLDGASIRISMGYQDANSLLSFYAYNNAAVPAGKTGVSATNMHSDAYPGAWATYGSFANTGRIFYDLYDMCFNPVLGYVGFRGKITGTWPGQ